MAVGAMAALREGGVTLPSEMAVAGFDGIATLGDVTRLSPRSACRWRSSARGRSRWSCRNPQEQPRVRRVRGEVVLRESTPPLG